MKLFLVLLVFLGGYTYVLLHTTSVVLGQTSRLEQHYQYVASYSDQIATGRAR